MKEAKNMRYYENWEEWISISRKQKTKDKLLFPRIVKKFKKGKILEIGAGVGQLSQYAKELGYQVDSTDYEPKFVEYMTRIGLNAMVVDATRIGEKLFDKYDTIFTQGVSTLAGKDVEIIEATYKSIYDTLVPGGRFIFILARGNKSRFSRLSEHKEIYKNVGFTELEVFRQQAFPSRLYGNKLIAWLESILGPLLGIQDIAVLEKPIAKKSRGHKGN